MSAQALLELRDLQVQFKTREGVANVLSGVNLKIGSGQTVGLVGESGSGKSMTARAILNMVPTPGRIVSGSVTLYSSSGGTGTELTRLPPNSEAIRQVRGKEIAMIFQEPMTSLSPVHTVGEQIAEAVRLHQGSSRREARVRAAEMLAVVGFPDPTRRLDSYPFQLSGGLRQRAMIAMALSCNPKLLIADEPTTALDVTLQAQILELLQRLQQEFDMSILMITHNLGVVAAVAERVAVMYAGQIVEEATTRELFVSPRHPYTQALLNAVPKLGTKGDLQAIQGSVPSPYRRVPGCPFHPRCPQAVPGFCDTYVPVAAEVSPGHISSCLLQPEVKAASKPPETAEVPS